MISKKIVLPVLTAVIVGSTVVRAGYAQAQSKDTGPFTGLAQAIAQKFNVDQRQVQQVINQQMQHHMTQKHQEVQRRHEERLSQLVKDGKITEAQKQTIINKMAEMKGKIDPSSFINMTEGQRKQAMERHQKELKDWATKQGIDPSILMPFGMGKHRLHMTGKPMLSPQP